MPFIVGYQIKGTCTYPLFSHSSCIHYSRILKCTHYFHDQNCSTWIWPAVRNMRMQATHWKSSCLTYVLPLFFYNALAPLLVMHVQVDITDGNSATVLEQTAKLYENRSAMGTMAEPLQLEDIRLTTDILGTVAKTTAPTTFDVSVTPVTGEYRWTVLFICSLFSPALFSFCKTDWWN